MKRTKKINDIIGQLEEMNQHLSDVVTQRESHYNSRSERFQNSEAGELYESETVTLSEAADEVDNLKDKIIELYPED